MSALDHDRLTRRFLAAVDLDAAARLAYLDRVRRDEPELFDELRSLLRHDADPPCALETGGAVRGTRLEPEAGAVIGAYRLLRRIGEGGMGIVYLAEQREPVRRLVALKLIRPGFESRSVSERFDAERRALEHLDHPNIARVLDAGTTGDRLPYVVMEWVRGEPITTFAERRGLDLRARLALFACVCDAVHHAHQNAILHRDVKPTNVLVAEVDGVPVPKVIDFGIAKALTREAVTGPALTRAGQMVGTPGYMSPEQARSVEGVDIRSDVYSLGCLLHELLAGCPPFDVGAFRGLGWDEIRTQLLQLEPSPPSVVLARRGRVPRGLARSLRGDVDWIVLKAVARERNDRYASAHDLASDIRRFLDDDPVDARPPSRLYRFRKFAARHRAGVAAVAAAIPLVLGFGTVMAFQAHRIARERDRAEEISEFLLGFTTFPRDVTSREGLRDPSEVPWNGLEKIRRELTDRPVLAARLEHAIAESVRLTGNPRGALPVLESASARLRTLVGSDDPETLAAGHDVALALRDLRRYREAEERFREVHTGRSRTLGRGHPDTLRALVGIGTIQKRTHRNVEAVASLSEARVGLAAALGAGDREVAFVTSLLGSVELDLGHLDDAEALIRDAMAHLGDDAKEGKIALYNLACIQAQRGQRAAALRTLRSVVERGFFLNFFADPNLAPLRGDPEFEAYVKSTLLYGRDMQDQLTLEAEFDIRRGRHRNAETLYRYALASLHTPSFNGYRSRLADLYLLEGRYAEAKPLLEETLEATRQDSGPAAVVTATRMLDVMEAQLGVEDEAAARRTLADATAIFEADPGYGAPMWALYARACRNALDGRQDEALRALEAAVEGGFSDTTRPRGSLALRALRVRPEFQRVLERIRRRYGLTAAEVEPALAALRSQAHD